MPRIRDPETVRGLLNKSQWIALDFLFKQELIKGKRGIWIETHRRCSSATARVLEEIGICKYEARLMLRGPRAGRIVKRVKLSGLARKLVRLGPPDGFDFPVGSHSWDVVRRVGV